MKGLRIMDVPVLLSVWVLCVTTDWSTGAKVALNVAAVAALCLKEYLVHRHLQRAAAPCQRSMPAGTRAFAAV